MVRRPSAARVATAGELRRLGYRCWAGLLDAADYGVPQNRVRAFLLAHAGGPPQPPVPTHAERPAVDLAGGTLEPWVSMAEALDRPAPGGDREAGRWRVATGNHSRVARGARGELTAPYEKDADRPGPTVTTNADRWRLRHSGHSQGRGRPQLTRSIDRPAPTFHFGHDEAGWAFYRPATAVTGEARVFAPGHHAINEAERSYYPGRSDGAVPLTLADALVLQGFPPDLPVAGDTKRARHLQVGNAVPPALAAAVLEAVIAAGPAGARPGEHRGPWTDLLPDLRAFAVPSRPPRGHQPALFGAADGRPAAQDGAA